MPINLKKPITYLTRDIERALGMNPGGDYFIIANRTPYADKIAQKYPDNILLIKAENILGTRELMEHQEVKDHFKTKPSDIVVFKNTVRVEEAAQKAGLHLLNPKAVLTEQVEGKITQLEWLGLLAEKYMPAHSVHASRSLRWMGEPFIIQWAHGHTGEGTILINSENELKALQDKFPHRTARRMTYIKGPSFTVNAVAASDRILIGNISYQITGMAPFTDFPFSTVGNDWALTHSLISMENIDVIRNITNDIGKKMNIAGWRGLFGIDVVQDEKSGRIFLIEVNARQPASVTFESTLQNQARETGARGLTTFEAHLKALLGEHIDDDLIELKDGAQIVQRITKNVNAASGGISAAKISSLESAGYTVIPYDNKDMNEDLVRIQSAKGIMEGHGKLNERGKQIEELIL